MDKAWLWKKKSTEKLPIVADKVNDLSKGNEEEMEAILNEKAELEKDIKALSDKLASALSDCKNKDEIVKKHANMAQEAVHGWEKVEAEAGFLKQELDKSLQLRDSAEERIAQLDGALKECMQQLRYVRDDQEQRVHDAVMKTTREFEKSQMVLEEKLAETSGRLCKIGAENSHLNKALSVKEKLTEDLRKQLSQMEADVNALMARLESTEKYNASLTYEVRVLEKELEIRNEEREFNCRTADAAHKQHLEGAKKVAKLELECQRLRVLVRKRLPGPAALAKMKNEVEMLGTDSVDMRMRSLSPNGFWYESTADKFHEVPTKKINFLTEQLCAMEEENAILKEALNKKMNELQFSKNMYNRAASKLSQVETVVGESPRGTHMPHELSVASMSDIGSDDKASCAESWASTLITELEHFKNEKQKDWPTCKTVGASDINLMDDFAEMEKLAVVTADKVSVGSYASSPANTVAGHLENQYSLELGGSDIVPVSDSESGFSLSNRESSRVADAKAPHWLQDIVKLVLEHSRVAGRSPKQIQEDIRIALATTTNPSSAKSSISWKYSNECAVTGSPNGASGEQLQPDLRKSICKIIELIEGISVPSSDYNTDARHKNSETQAGYMVRVFQWKTSELGSLLQQFIHACYNLLNGKDGLDKFAEELTTALDWILNHCFSLQDVSSMKDAIKKQFDWDDTRSESEAEVGMAISSNGCSTQLEELQSNMVQEIRKLKDELVNTESGKRELEGRLQSASDKSEFLINQLKESEKIVGGLQEELLSLRESKSMIEDQLKTQEAMNEDLSTQLTVARVELSEAQQKLSSLEDELENKYKCCEELEASCVDLQLQLKSMKKKSPDSDHNQEERQDQTEWEITAASEKLAECQETILNLGKQLKAMAAPREAALFDKVITDPADVSTTTVIATDPTSNKTMSRRSSLLDRMLAEDDTTTKEFTPPKTKQVDDNSTSIFGPKTVVEPLENILNLNVKYQDENAATGSLAMVPSKKRSVSLWRKLLWRKKKSSSKKAPLPIAS
ncbi:filament-like plant protein 7 isoform X2 [Argentina anserina]|uniref:filament-like plant protein 7 isoform X2 n=1 Tax=Argentina anserina TaxID=57926 RepID=UPI0021764497|nr:filament-like plant protein 7 isoform X2 [Potentilla anserina]